MKTVDQLKDYFNNDLMPEILQVENKRKGIVLRIILLGVGLIVLLVLGYLGLDSNPSLNSWGWKTMFILTVGVLGFVAFNEIRNNRDFYNDFKTNVIEKIVKFIDPSFTYISHKYIQPTQLVESKLFAHLPKKYKGDDYAVGVLGRNTKVEFSEVVARHRHRLEEGSKGDWTITFKGLFFVAQVEKTFSGQTFVIPKDHGVETLMAGSGAPPTAVASGNSDFDNLFNIFSTNPAEAKTLISPEIQRHLIDFRANRTNDVRFSFIGTKINVAVFHEKDLFEPEVFKTLVDFGIIEEYYDDLYQAISVVESIDRSAKS